MTYATLAQLIDRVGEPMLIELTDRGEVSTGAVVLAVVDRALADTDALIDGYLGRYSLPLATTPPILADIAGAIALWKLHLTTPEDKVKVDYDAAMRSLREISQGVIRLPDAQGLEPGSSGASGVIVTDRERPFTADNMKGFI
ncbi:MAG: gp436 family protein [Cypionkella sp.]